LIQELFSIPSVSAQIIEPHGFLFKIKTCWTCWCILKMYIKMCILKLHFHCFLSIDKNSFQFLFLLLTFSSHATVNVFLETSWCYDCCWYSNK